MLYPPNPMPLNDTVSTNSSEMPRQYFYNPIIPAHLVREAIEDSGSDGEVERWDEVQRSGRDLQRGQSKVR